MARRVFFSFHYQNDISRVSRIRNSWLTKPDRETAGFWDAASWETVKKQGEEAIKRWINNQLDGTSVTVVLIGKETAYRKYVRYEIKKSYAKGNGMLGIYIHNMRDLNGGISEKGENPFDKISLTATGEKLSKFYKTYNWVSDNGYENMGKWIDEAALSAQLKKIFRKPL